MSTPASRDAKGGKSPGLVETLHNLAIEDDMHPDGTAEPGAVKPNNQEQSPMSPDRAQTAAATPEDFVMPAQDAKALDLDHALSAFTDALVAPMNKEDSFPGRKIPPSQSADSAQLRHEDIQVQFTWPNRTGRRRRLSETAGP